MAQLASEQISLTPPDHVRLLHPIGRCGIVAVSVQAEKWVERAVPIRELPAYAAAMRGGTDIFFSQQSFYGWRRISQLAQLGAFYSDLDYRNSRYAGEAPERVAEAVVNHLRYENLPVPSYILATGRGLLSVWLHDLVPRNALPRWNAVQTHLWRTLAPFGADRRSIDAAHVFRLTGTYNSKPDASGMVRLVWNADELDRLVRWSFDDLANEILPRTRDQLALSKVSRTYKGQQRNTKVTTIRNAATLWETVLTDLQRLRQYRWFGPLPPGQRDDRMFIAANAMSWLTSQYVPHTLKREFHALAREAGGWETTECNARLSAILKRAEEASRGVKHEWNGLKVDPRYRFKAETLVERLNVTPREMREANLRVIIDKDVDRERNAERQTAFRRCNGAQERSTYEAFSLAKLKPWEADGISRATWFRRRGGSETSP